MSNWQEERQLARPSKHSMTLSALVFRQDIALRRLTNWHAIEGVRDNLSYAFLLSVALRKLPQTLLTALRLSCCPLTSLCIQSCNNVRAENHHYGQLGRLMQKLERQRIDLCCIFVAQLFTRGFHRPVNLHVLGPENPFQLFLHFFVHPRFPCDLDCKMSFNVQA